MDDKSLSDIQSTKGGNTCTSIGAPANEPSNQSSGVAAPMTEDGKYNILSLKDLLTMQRKIKKNNKVVMDVTRTKYDVVRTVGTENFEWNLVDNDADDKSSVGSGEESDENESAVCNDLKKITGDFNVMWCDTYIPEELLRKLLPYQKVNHFPGSHLVGMKNNLCKNLTTLRKEFPQEYDFFPRSWHLPYQFEDLRKFNAEHPKSYFIVKPEASCQGRGIFITKNPESELSYQDHYVVQEYVANPYLIDGLKFDMRVYVLIRSVNPLKIFLYREGLARLATEPYEKPNAKNRENMCIHLTNYAVNKLNPKFQFNDTEDKDNVGHKRSFSSVLKHLEEAEGSEAVSGMMMEIRRLIIKTMCTVQPVLAHVYRSCQNKEENNGMCFEILGFDVMIDTKLKPWLLEVNHTPSFTADTPLDLQIKKSLILDTLNLVNINPKAKKQYLDSKSSHKPIQKLTQQEKDELNEKNFKYEERRLGGFIRILPAKDDPVNYNQYMDCAKRAWDAHTGTTRKKVEAVQDAKDQRGGWGQGLRSTSNKALPPGKDMKNAPNQGRQSAGKPPVAAKPPGVPVKPTTTAFSRNYNGTSAPRVPPTKAPSLQLESNATKENGADDVLDSNNQGIMAHSGLFRSEHGGEHRSNQENDPSVGRPNIRIRAKTPSIKTSSDGPTQTPSSTKDENMNRVLARDPSNGATNIEAVLAMLKSNRDSPPEEEKGSFRRPQNYQLCGTGIIGESGESFPSIFAPPGTSTLYRIPQVIGQAVPVVSRNQVESKTQKYFINGATSTTNKQVVASRVPMKIAKADIQDFTDLFLQAKQLNPVINFKESQVSNARMAAANQQARNAEMQKLRLVIQRKAQMPGQRTVEEQLMLQQQQNQQQGPSKLVVAPPKNKTHFYGQKKFQE